MFEFLQKLFIKTQTWDGSERRQMIRCHCEVELDLVKPKCPVKVREIGQAGLLLECSFKELGSPRPGSSLELTQPGCPPVKVSIRWVKSTTETTRLGVRFCKPLAGTWMQRLIDDLAGHPRQKRRCIRVRTDWQITAIAGNFQTEVRLRDLSVNGCRFESRESFLVGQSLRLKMAELEIQAEVRRIVGIGNLSVVGVRFCTQERETRRLSELLRKLTGG